MNPGNLLRRLFPTSRRLLVEKSLAFIGYRQRGAILVVGSGHDPYHAHLREAERYVCLDITNYTGVTDIVGDAQFLPFCDESFDCIVATEIMEHLKDPPRFIVEAKRVLRRGGEMILTVPFMFHQHADPGDYWRPTRRCIEMLLADFSEVSITSQGNRVHVLSDIITTSFHPFPVFLPLRVFNHILARLPRSLKLNCNSSTCPSGFFISAKRG